MQAWKTDVKTNMIMMNIKRKFKNNQKMLKPNPNVKLLTSFFNFELVFQNIVTDKLYC